MKRIELLLIILICYSVNELKWCEIEIDQNSNNTINNTQKVNRIKCFEDEMKIDCFQKIFYINGKDIIFQENVKRSEVEIICDDEKIKEYQFLFKNEIKSVKNSTLKGDVENCQIHICSGSLCRLLSLQKYQKNEKHLVFVLRIFLPLLLQLHQLHHLIEY